MVLKELCAIRGVSGDEDRVRDYIRRMVEPYATSVKVDRLGNLIVHKKGTVENGRHIVIAAHMDEVGMIVRGINENGLISYSTVGGIDPRTIVSKPVRIGENEVPGVIGAKAIHLQRGAERDTVLPHNELYIDIGAADKASAERLVEVGDYISFESGWVEFGDGMVKSRALDDRIGCMVMMSILEGEYPCDVTCVFTVQEEPGTRGSMAAAYTVQSDAAIILEATAANDMGDPDEVQKVCCVKQGVAVSFMDKASLVCAPLFDRMRDLAIENRIPWQIKSGITGGNDAGPFQRLGGARSTCVLSTPTRYIHSPSCVAAFADIEAQYRLVEAFLMAGGAF